MINVNLIYPIGSIYISINNKNPSDIFGGIWEQIKGKMLIGVDEDDSDFATSKLTGGEKEHTLTIDEMPQHDHNFFRGFDGGEKIVSLQATLKNGTWDSITDHTSMTATGGSKPHNNMPPYYTVYIFVRTA